ncbi:MAG: class I poly(R)-hydroxyalkanoic acid synthase [Pseudomonadota bacterium]
MSQKQIPPTPDPAKLAENWNTIAERSRRLLEDFAKKQAAGELPNTDPNEFAVITRPLQTFIERVSRDPTQLMSAQFGLWQDSITLWQRMGQKMMGGQVDPVIEPAPGDKRFKDDAWIENPVFDFIMQSYLLAAKYTTAALPTQDHGSTDSKKKSQQLEFYTKQFIDAMSPSNFAATNPAVLRETVNSGGENLVNGLKNLLDDLGADGQLRVKMTALDEFEVGKNVGTTPGKVVFETPLIQLIQYTPTTETVYKRPLLIIPPWINKFYILDLQPKNSFIKYAVDQGHTVFVISWVNPDEALTDKSFDDYLLEGSLAALDAIEKATGERDVNLVGYCLGGTLTACTVAYLEARNDKRVKSATYFASLVDFSEPGDLGVFIDEEHLDLVDRQMKKKGYLDGSTMATAFNALRANDLIWSFVVNNYLMGKEPFPFDLLFWNSDATRMPRVMHNFYLREMYLENRLREPGGISLNQTPLDLRAVKAPTYIVSTKDDHIAPWRSTYAATQLYSGQVRFVLGGSGHIAGIINPPSAKKYGHWIGTELGPDPDEWLANATAHDGSWWNDWRAWVRKYAGKKVPARVPGDAELAIIEDAPGRYVQVRAA